MNLSTIALFGGSGRTGKLILDQLLARGHHVRLLTRKPLHIGGNVTEIIGDATNAEDVRRTLDGADAVVSTLGTDKNDVLQRFTAIVIDEMTRHGIKRIVTVGTAGILQATHEPDRYRYETRESKRTMKVAAMDHSRAYEQLDASPLDYTIICPTQLVDVEKNENVFISEHTLATETSGPISRAAVAALALDALQNGRHVRMRVGITTIPD